ncbi:MAG TPA: universal stress protein [Jatrophihabitans sp.]|jgi:nucleotide-binding universal stress UspA family protein|nr:universal stress protein [Jatrophihabitans sp.]
MPALTTIHTSPDSAARAEHGPEEPGSAIGSPAPVIVCYDGSPDAVRALGVAAKLFPGRSAAVVHVWPGVAVDRIRTTHVEDLRAELIKEVRVAALGAAKATAREGAALASRAGLDARPRAIEATDGTAAAVEQVAENESAVAVVIGRRQRRHLGALPHGSLPRTLIEHGAVPVVVA